MEVDAAVDDEKGHIFPEMKRRKLVASRGAIVPLHISLFVRCTIKYFM